MASGGGGLSRPTKPKGDGVCVYGTCRGPKYRSVGRDYCRIHLHLDPAPRCTGMDIRGRRCSRIADRRGGRCPEHHDQERSLFDDDDDPDDHDDHEMSDEGRV